MDILEKINILIDEDFGELNELRPKRVKHKRGSKARKARRKAKIMRRKNRAKIKKMRRKLKRIHKRPSYKKKVARMAKRGKTPTGRRKRKYF